MPNIHYLTTFGPIRQASLKQVIHPSVMGSGNSTNTLLPRTETNTVVSTTESSTQDMVNQLPSSSCSPQQHVVNKVPLGYVMMSCSLPLWLRGYYLYYHSSLDAVVEGIATKHHITVADLLTTPPAAAAAADSHVQRQLGLAVAGRALKVASLVSVGTFGMLWASIFVVMGWNSVQEGIVETRQWAQYQRHEWEEFLRRQNIVGEKGHHPVTAANNNNQHNRIGNTALLDSVQESVAATRQWAQCKRQELEEILGVPNRVHQEEDQSVTNNKNHTRGNNILVGTAALEKHQGSNHDRETSDHDAPK